MNQKEQQLIALKKAVKEPLSAMTAIEVTTPALSRSLIGLLQETVGDRPFHVLDFDGGQNPGQYHEECRQIVESWPRHAGVLCLTDLGKMDERQNHKFWGHMNLLREAWGYLPCHLIIILFPNSYLHFLRTADHLADWVPLKFHFTEPFL